MHLLDAVVHSVTLLAHYPLPSLCSLSLNSISSKTVQKERSAAVKDGLQTKQIKTCQNSDLS